MEFATDRSNAAARLVPRVLAVALARGTVLAFEDRMRFVLERLKEKERTSLWLIPGVAAVAAILLARVLPAIETKLLHERVSWYLFAGEPESARQLLSTIASAMMTFTALVFSITILVLQLASSQFSPRILRTFLEDDATRSAMAMFVGTFVCAMALLPEVRSKGAIGGERLPGLSVFLAFVFVLVSVGIFIRYIHRMAHSIRSVSVVWRVAHDGLSTLDKMYPEMYVAEPASAFTTPVGRPRQIIRHDSEGGVLVAVDETSLMEVAEEQDAVILVVPQLGDFVVRGTPLFHVWAAHEVDEHCLRAAVAIEDERTPHQDPSFAIRQLVDVAERALSPGINDPTTAVQALDRIHDLMTALATRRFPPTHRVDASGNLRLIVPRAEWDDLVHLAFDEVRQNGRGSIQVVRRMRAALLALHALCPEPRRAVVELELEELDRMTAVEFSTVDRELARRPSAQGQGAASPRFLTPQSLQSRLDRCETDPT